MKSVRIAPTDVWLFRDGKPFNADSDHRARSMFPPLPTVTQGVLRGHYLADQKVALDRKNKTEIEKTVGTATDFLDLRLRGPFVRRGSQLFFPMPADVVKGSDENFHPLSVFSKAPGDGSFSHPNGAPYALIPDPKNDKLKDPQKIEEDWVSQDQLELYLKGNSFKGSTSSGLYSRELRPGNAIDSDKQTTIEGRLYQVEFIRLHQDVCLQVDVMAGLKAWKRTNGLMRIGGEGHAASFTVSNPSQPDVPLPVIGSAKRFKMVLLTPTFFAEGWIPKDWNAYFTGGTVELKAAAIKKYISVGGFDLMANNHKPSLRYVDAGSVYYFEVTSGAPEFRSDEAWLCDVAPNGAPLGHIGFGQVRVGNWNLAN